MSDLEFGQVMYVTLQIPRDISNKVSAKSSLRAWRYLSCANANRCADTADCTEQFVTLRQSSQRFIRSATCACQSKQHCHASGLDSEACALTCTSSCCSCGKHESAEQADSHCCKALPRDSPLPTHIALCSRQWGIWHSFEQ